MKITLKVLIALIAALGMTIGCASGSPSSDEDPRQTEGAEPMDEEPSPTQDPAPNQPATQEDPEPREGLQPVDPEATSSNSVGDSEIDAFVDTYREVAEVRQAYQERMSQAPTSEDARALQQEAATALQSVIERGELEPERFAEIAKIAETDPNVAQKIRERMANGGSNDS